MFATTHATRRFVLPALALVAVTGGLAACGDDDSSDTPETTVPVETEPTETTPETTEPAETTPETTTPSDTTEPGGTDAEADLPTEESAEDLVDLTEDEATEAAEERGWTIRVANRDGEDLPGTMDLRENRVNVEVTDGVVTAILSIG